MKKDYDFLIVGSGLFGAVFAQEAIKHGQKVLVLERRPQVGGNLACQNKDGIWLHSYGAHIFHTNSQIVWNYVNQFTKFYPYIHTPLANYHGELYNLPFNMHTFYQLWGTKTAKQAKQKIAQQKSVVTPQNLEEYALTIVGEELYRKLIQGYTEKQWGRACKDLPAFILKRIPLRFGYDNNYFDSLYQGIPTNSYNVLIEKLLVGSTILLNTDFFNQKEKYLSMAHRVLYTGAIDAYFNYRYGALAYRSLRFVSARIAQENYQGVAVMNFTDRETPYTRIIEHKHFSKNPSQPVTWITKEYPLTWTKDQEPYYPINDKENQTLYEKYKQLAQQEPNVLFGGRLGEYRYYNMDQVVEAALHLAHSQLKAK